MPTTGEYGAKPNTMQLDGGWKCGPSGASAPISEADALAKLNQITQVMFGSDAASSLGNYSYSTQLDALKNGVSTTGCIASLATSEEFGKQIWRVAVGAAFDFCAEMLGIDSSPDAPALKEGMICNYYNPAVNSNIPIINFGWILSSLVQQDAWVKIDPNCDHIPAPLPPTAFPAPCPSTKARAEK